MNIGFFVRHFTERGTEVAVYDYANYNETILNNKSFIICFTEQAHKQFRLGPVERISYDKFSARFPIIEIDNITDMAHVIEKYNLSFFHTLTYGGGNDIYQFENKSIWGSCKTIKHCVFDTKHKEGDFYVSISEALNRAHRTCLPVVPHMIDLPDINEDLRDDLRIPKDAIVIGRYGGMEEFNIETARQSIVEYLITNPNSNMYFLFMNTPCFYVHPKIIYLPRNVDVIYKTKFINTCDAMIHARKDGETFGLSIAEFSVKNKPVITCPCGDLAHIDLLGDKALLYRSKPELLDIFMNIKEIIHSREDWNAYALYNPNRVMHIFKELIFDHSVSVVQSS